MKKILTSLLALATIFFSSCHQNSISLTDNTVTPTVQSATTIAVKDISVTIAKNNWAFVLPSDEWVTIPNTNFDAALTNKSNHNMIILIVETTELSLQDYFAQAIQGVRASGATVLSVKHTKISNGMPAVLLESSKDGIKIYTWVSLLGKQGYGFSCGGSDLDYQKVLCDKIVATLTIK